MKEKQRIDSSANNLSNKQEMLGALYKKNLNEASKLFSFSETQKFNFINQKLQWSPLVTFHRHGPARVVG